MEHTSRKPSVLSDILTLVLVVLSVSSVAYYFNLLYTLDLTQDYKKDFAQQHEFFILDQYHNELWNEFISDDESLDKIVRINNKLHSHEAFEYYEAVFRDIYILKDDYAGDSRFGASHDYDPERYDEEHDDRAAIKGFFVSPHYLEKNAVPVSYGRLFDEQDYYFSDTVPVLLGAGYRGLYEIGDSFTVIYFGRQMQASVIGFLPEQSYIEQATAIHSLDDYLIAPMQFHAEIAPMRSEAGSYQLKLYLEKNTGLLFTDLDYESVQRELRAITESEGMLEFDLYGGRTLKTIEATYKPLRFLLLGAAVLACALCAANAAYKGKKYSGQPPAIAGIKLLGSYLLALFILYWFLPFIYVDDIALYLLTIAVLAAVNCALFFWFGRKRKEAPQV